MEITKFQAIFEKMIRNRENDVRITFTVSASELGKIILIPAETNFEIVINPVVEK